MSIKLYECHRCHFPFPYDTGEDCSTDKTAEGSVEAKGVRCPRCGNTEAKALPYSSKMVVEALAKHRARSGSRG